MPVINIEYDDSKVSDQEALEISNAVQKTVSDVTQIQDVFVYANSARIKVKVAPIEIFIRISAHMVPDTKKTLNELKIELLEWKMKINFRHPINLTLIKMDWEFEIGI